MITTIILALVAAAPFTGFLLPGALAWFFGGGIMRTVAAGVVIAPLAFFGGYLKGKNDADATAEINRLNAIIVGMEFDASQKEIAEKQAAKEVEENAARDAENQTVTGTIDHVIESAPSVGGCFAPGYLDGLRKLK